MPWHCVNDNTKYCDGEPEWEKEPQAVKGIEDGKKVEEIRFYAGGTCKLSPETCGRCKTSKELWEETPKEIREKVEKSHFVETIIPIKKEEQGTVKPKSAKAKKLEKEMQQGRML